MRTFLRHMCSMELRCYIRRSICLRIILAGTMLIFIGVQFVKFATFYGTWNVGVFPLETQPQVAHIQPQVAHSRPQASHNQSQVTYNRPQAAHASSLEDNCPDALFELNQLQHRIDRVRNYLRQPEGAPRESILVVGPPGALSESIGELLGRSSEVFYLPDVLRSLSYYIRHEPGIGFPLVNILIEDLFKCVFNENELLVSNLIQNSTRKRSPSLEKLPSCVAMGTDTEHCSKVVSDWLTKMCHRRKVTVAQSIFVRSISALASLGSEVTYRPFRFKVIHVVRDPRAIFHSLSALTNSELTPNAKRTSAYRLCLRMALNLDTGAHPPAWLDNRYNLVPIETLLSEPRTRMAELYEFAGILPHESLQRMDNNISEFLAAFGLNEDTVNAWRKEMPLTDVKIVETECKRVMDFVGYRNVTSS